METPSLLFPASLTLVLGALAGCLGDVEDATTDALGLLPDELLAAIVDEHDHADPALHGQSNNIEILGYSAGLPDPTVYGEVDVRGGVAALAVLHTVGAQRSGVVFFDAAKPDALEPLGSWFAPSPTVYAADVKLSDDGNWAFVASQPFGRLRDELLRERGMEPPMTPEQVPALMLPVAGNVVDTGVYILDIRDKTMPPRLAGFHEEQMFGVHMLDVHTVNDVTYLFLQSGTAVIPCYTRVTQAMMDQCVGPGAVPPGTIPGDPLASLGGNRITIAEFVVQGDRALLRPVQTFAGTAGESIHDMTVVDDPVLQKTLMYVAHWDDGVHIVDVSGLPGAITTLGTWSPERFKEDGATEGNVHTVMAEVLGERRIVVASPEFGNREVDPPFYVLDATDAAAATEVANWSLPGEHNYSLATENNPLYRWSTHNVNLEHGILYLAHFHGGVWVFDLMADPAKPTVIGYTMLAPQDRGPGAFFGAIGDSPSAWDVVPYEGVMWISDINGGLYTARLVEVPEHLLEQEGIDHAAMGHS